MGGYSSPDKRSTDRLAGMRSRQRRRPLIQGSRPHHRERLEDVLGEDEAGAAAGTGRRFRHRRGPPGPGGSNLRMCSANWRTSALLSRNPEAPSSNARE